MRVLFFTHIYFGDLKRWVSKINKLPGIAISNYEKGFVDSILTIKDFSLTLVNRPFLSSLSPDEQINTNTLYKDIAPIIEMPFFTGKHQDARILKYIKTEQRIRKAIIESDLILFSTYHDFRLFKLVKKINHNCKSFLFLPDLPSFVINKSSVFHVFKRKIEAKRFYDSCKRIDGLFPITESIGKYMKKRIKFHYPLQGAIKDEDISSFERSSNNKTIIYSGGLAQKYGVLDLINAFKKTPFYRDYKLLIFGKGECEEQIKQISSNDPYISFMGFVPREQILNTITQATFLVVPENPKNDYSKYSFHSKILEYMASGVPTITYFYEGIPSNYYPYLLEIKRFNGNTEIEIQRALDDYYHNISYSENITFGLKAKEYIKFNNSPCEIGKKILSFIEEVVRN